MASKAENEKGLGGIQLALKVLCDHNGKADKAHAAADGAGGGIIGLFEVVESDFTKALAKMSATEESAQIEFDQQTKLNEIDKTTKDQDVKYRGADVVSPSYVDAATAGICEVLSIEYRGKRERGTE